MHRRLLLTLAVLAAASSASLAVAQGRRAGARALTVFAASSLTDAFTALKPGFEARNPGWTVTFNFGASSALRTQIDQGAPADVFAAADRSSVQPLVDSKKLAEPAIFARNRLVVAYPARNPAHLRRLQDLARPGLRLVTTSESVPIGRYTREVLEKLGKLPDYPNDFAKRVAANFVSEETNVRALIARLELAEADAAFVYESDLQQNRRLRAMEIPFNANVVAEYPIAAVAASPQRPGADLFVKFVLSPEGQRTLRGFGFR